MATNWSEREPLTQVGPVSLEPGTMVRGTIDAGVTGIPLIVYSGARPGPVLYVQALQHGLELNGCDVMRRLVQSLDPASISGTLILVPMANPLAARVHMQSYPYPDRPTERQINDMNRRWHEGHQSANAVDAQVDALMPIVALGDACIDLHCHEYLYSCLALTDMAIPAGAELAVAMGLEVIRTGDGTEGMFGRHVRETLGKVGITVEMPPLRRVDHTSSQIGARSVLNAMKHMGMLAGEPELPPSTAIFGTASQQSETVVAQYEGFMARYAEPGECVREGQVVAEIFGPQEFDVVQRLCAPFDGFVMSIGRPPQAWGDPEQDYVNVGDRIASFTTASRIIERGP